MELPRRPTAIIMGDNTRAVHVLNICTKAGIKVPEALSILGFPDTSESTLTSPPLTVIDGPTKW